MTIKFVVLYTDVLLYCLIALGVGFFFWARRKEHLRAPWRQVIRSKMGVVALLILSLYFFAGVLDSIHFQTLGAGQETAQITPVKSVLDVLLSPLGDHYEKTYSAPFATTLYTRSTLTLPNGQRHAAYPRLEYGGKHLVNTVDRSHDLFVHSVYAAMVGLLCWVLFAMLVVIVLALQQGESIKTTYLNIVTAKTAVPWWLILLTTAVLFVLLSEMIGLAPLYHLFGTDKIGQDVFYESVKSIRTGLLIGTLTTFIMLPFALLFGTMAGYFGGWIDDAIQYVYTTLSSIPGVLLIAAAILALQIFMANHPAWFPSMIERADVRLLALCIILGVTSWTSLCRLLRAETLKCRELDYIQAAKTLGVRDFTIILRHIFPNVMHLVLITVVLDFSGLVLAEAVLSYVGVGVDPTTMSWGNMINGARLELAREPVVWWPLLAAFIFMFILVLAANLFSDVVRDAFDPRLRTQEQ